MHGVLDVDTRSRRSPIHFSEHIFALFARVFV